MTFDRSQLEKDKRENALKQARDKELTSLALDFVVKSDRYNYGYQWSWLGLPIIQLPADIVATQEIIWDTKPDVIIETGIAWGGSVLLYAALQELIGKGRTIAVDLNLYEHVAEQIMSYPFSRRIQLYKGSSTDPDVAASIRSQIAAGDSVMVLLDSNHTHDHVLAELRTYGPLVTAGQFLVVSDTIVEDIPEQTHRPRPWSRGNNPKTALRQYLTETDRFVADPYVDAKLLTTFTPQGYLRCVK